MSTIASPPFAADDAKAPLSMSKPQLLWLLDLVARLQACLQFLKIVTLTNQSAAIAATPITLGVVSAGTYRLAWYARVTTVDGVNSSLTPTMRWTENGVALSISGAAMTGDSVTTVQSGVIEVQVDASSAISYSTAYASNTPAKMRYTLRVSATRVA